MLQQYLYTIELWMFLNNWITYNDFEWVVNSLKPNLYIFELTDKNSQIKCIKNVLRLCK